MSSRGRKDNWTSSAGFLHLDDDQNVPRPKTDDAVVSQAGRSQSYSQFKRVYNEIIADINKRGAHRPASRPAGSGRQQWIKEAPASCHTASQAGFLPARRAVAPFGYRRMNNKEDWVLGSQTASRGIKLGDLLDRYYGTRTLEEFLDGIRIAKFDSKRKRSTF
jgi:hypothetical protein